MQDLSRAVILQLPDCNRRAGLRANHRAGLRANHLAGAHKFYSPILLISAGPGVHLNGWLHDFVPTLGLSWGR